VAGAFMLVYMTIIEYHTAVASVLQGSKLRKLATRMKPRIDIVTPKPRAITPAAKNTEEVVTVMLRIQFHLRRMPLAFLM
jgi:hypothetical protein